MARNKGHQALQDYYDDMQLIVSCVANDVCFTYPNSFGRHALNWSNGAVRLHCSNAKDLFIDIGQEVEDPSKSDSKRVSTKRYIYSILDEEGKDLIGFHYHPELDDDPVLYPHIHVYAETGLHGMPLPDEVIQR